MSIICKELKFLLKVQKYKNSDQAASLSCLIELSLSPPDCRKNGTFILFFLTLYY